jgi:hypothetical protein
MNRTRMTRRKPAILALLLIALTLATFARAVPNDFVGWDDPDTISSNPRLNPPSFDSIVYYWTHSDGGLYVPVTYTLWVALAAIARVRGADGSVSLNPWVFHGASVVIHILSVLLVFSILRRLRAPDVAAFFGAALFAVHPLQVESVAWASGAKDLLGGMFTLLMIDQFLRGSKTGWVLALVAMILGVLAKPITVVAPAIAAILAIGILQEPARKTFQSLAPMFAIALACVAWSRAVQPAYDPTWTPLWTRPLIALDAIAFYLCKLFVPTKLAVIYGRTPRAAVESGAIYYAWLLPAIVAVILWQLRRRSRWLVCAGLVMLVALLPVSGLARFMFQIHSTVADHYMYLPMLGPAMALAWLVDRHGHRPAAATIVTGGLCLFAVVSVVQFGYWRNSIALFNRAIVVTPNSATAHSNLGVAYAAAGELDRAVPHFETAVRLSRGQNRLAHTNLAQAYLFRHDYEQAAYHAREALRLAQLEPPDLRNTRWEEQLLAAALTQLQQRGATTTRSATQP